MNIAAPPTLTTDLSADKSVRPPEVFPPSLQIAGVAISPATVLAPMAGVTDTVFRRFIKNLGGCGLIMTEFTSADGVLRDQRVRASATCISTKTSIPYQRNFSAAIRKC